MLVWVAGSACPGRHFPTGRRALGGWGLRVRPAEEKQLRWDESGRSLETLKFCQESLYQSIEIHRYLHLLLVAGYSSLQTSGLILDGEMGCVFEAKEIFAVLSAKLLDFDTRTDRVWL